VCPCGSQRVGMACNEAALRGRLRSDSRTNEASLRSSTSCTTAHCQLCVHAGLRHSMLAAVHTLQARARAAMQVPPAATCGRRQRVKPAPETQPQRPARCARCLARGLASSKLRTLLDMAAAVTMATSASTGGARTGRGSTPLLPES
jgi:hypothetical protein